jgi:ABC-type multidrug transport system fused ATPase/permease subunit
MSFDIRVPVRTLLGRLWHHLGPRRQRQFALLMALTLLGTLAEVVSLGAVLPFLSILIVPEKVFNHPFISHHAPMWGITAAEQLVLPLTIGFVTIALVAGTIRLLLLWANTKFAFASGAELSMEVYRRTLYQPYRVHLARNSSEVVSGIITKVNDVVFWAMLPVLTLISSAVLLVALTFTLLFIDPVVALTAIAGFGASYSVITWLSRQRLKQNAQRITDEQTRVVKALQEGLGGIRDVLLDGTQPVYCDVYKQADRPLRQAYGSNIFIAGSPRFAMEAMGIALIACLAYALSRQAGGVAASLPVLGALALGAQRLLPALQQAYSAWASINGSYSSLADTVVLLDQPLPEEMHLPPPAPLPFEKSIRFDNVLFRYTGDGPRVLDGFSLTIPKGARVGIVGSSGSGKSTALDLLMGLLNPTEGTLLVDDQPCVGSRVRAWQKTIAHVPQSIYLADTTLAENIAFGVSKDAIDMDLVRRAARQAQIADFIESRPGGFQANVGERGIRLSGGQRQRIGIARALYKQAKVLLFDEATSALDNATELSVMDAIDGLDRDLTILLVAHRITTLSRCDRIVELEHGRVKREGSYAQLLGASPAFGTHN